MTNLISCIVDFQGRNKFKCLKHCLKFKSSSDLYKNILVKNGLLYFDARYEPPLNNLKLLAENFDVSFDLSFSDNNFKTEKIHFTCLQDEPLSPTAEYYRKRLNKMNSIQEHSMISSDLNRFSLARSLDLRELGILTSLLDKCRGNAFLNNASVIHDFEGYEPDINEQEDKGFNR